MFARKPPVDDWPIRRARERAVKHRAAASDDRANHPPTMTISLDIGILLALLCAFVANLAFFYKYRGANAVAKVTVTHPLRSARALYSSGWFALGMGIAVLSWALHVAALAMAPMSVVQVSLAAGVVFIAVMA